ncbi:MAG: hypothetical protein M1118_09895 [Chloroflexi bacterium]|nr:hypothetical protein [Chloroflexota bacterium]
MAVRARGVAGLPAQVTHVPPCWEHGYERSAAKVVIETAPRRGRPPLRKEVGGSIEAHRAGTVGDKTWTSPTRLVVLALIALLLHQLFYAWAIGWDAIDDAYISFRYALNMVQGHGLVFNPGEYVQGYTNFLWTVLMAVPIALHLPIGPASLFLGAICGWAVLVLTVRWSLPRQPFIAALATLLLAADGSFALWSVSGMETSFFTLLVVAGVLRYWHEAEHPEARPWSGLLLAIATLARPEGGLVMVMTAAHAAAFQLRQRQFIIDRRDLLRIVLYVPLVAAYALFSWRYYGSPLPNTFTDKVDVGSAAQAHRGLELAGVFLLGHGVVLLPIAVAVGCWVLLRQGEGVRGTHSVFIIVPYTAYIIAVGGDWSVGRFFVPFLPFVYLLTAAALSPFLSLCKRWADRLQGRPAAGIPSQPSRSRVLMSTALLMVVLFTGSSLLGEYALFVRRFHVAAVGAARTDMGKWLATNVPPDATIAVDAAGQMPYYAGHYVIDLYGLNDAHIARLKTSRIGRTLPGHEKFGLDYAIRTYHPDYIAIYGNILSAPVYRTQYRRLAVPWTHDPQLLHLLNVYERRPPSGPGFCHVAAPFQALDRALSTTAGQCTGAALHDPKSGDLVQHTQHGILVQDKASGFVSFSDGYHTWVDGPRGIQERLNFQRFSWEPNPTHLPIVTGG